MFIRHIDRRWGQCKALSIDFQSHSSRRGFSSTQFQFSVFVFRCNNKTAGQRAIIFGMFRRTLATKLTKSPMRANSANITSMWGQHFCSIHACFGWISALSSILRAVSYHSATATTAAGCSLIHAHIRFYSWLTEVSYIQLTLPNLTVTHI